MLTKQIVKVFRLSKSASGPCISLLQLAPADNCTQLFPLANRFLVGTYPLCSDALQYCPPVGLGCSGSCGNGRGCSVGYVIFGHSACSWRALRWAVLASET